MKEKILDVLEKHYYGRNFIEDRCANDLMTLFDEMKVTEEEYENALRAFLMERINFKTSKDTIIQAKHSDVVNLAADSFWFGCSFVMNKFGIELENNHADIETNDTVEPSEK